MTQAITIKPNDLIKKEHIEQYWEEGYTRIEHVFNQQEIAHLMQACERWKFTGQLLGHTWRKQNTIMWVNEERDGAISNETVVRGMQWPSYHDPVMDHFRTDPRLLMILEPIIGINIKQIINQVHWKKPGSKVTWPLHRDVRSRQPVEDFQELFSSWVQTGIAIDPHREENGAMSIVPGSHKDYPSDPNNADLFYAAEYETDSRIKVLEMNPGDVALWNAYTVHGGGFNVTSHQDRRLYINGFVKADKCARGEWAWKEGRTCHLHGKQALIQFNEIDTIADAFYARDHGREERITD